MANHSRVWIYVADRELTVDECESAEHALKRFVQQWAAHQVPLTADGLIMHQRFLVIMVDEERNGASGCSIDASVHFVQQLGGQLGVDFFDRMTFFVKDRDEIRAISRSEMKAQFASGQLDENSLVIDSLVKTKADLDSSFVKRLGDSWHRRLV